MSTADFTAFGQPCPRCGKLRWPTVSLALCDSRGRPLFEYTCWDHVETVTWRAAKTLDHTFAETEGGYSLTAGDVILTASRVRWVGEELSMEVVIASGGDVIGPVILLPLKPSSRRDVLNAVAEADRAAVALVMSDLCNRIIGRERQNATRVVSLRTVPRPNTDQLRLSIDPLPPLYRNHFTIWFGDGGSAKSINGLLAAGKLAAQGLRVLYLDWELDQDDHRLRYEQMFGAEMPDSVLYLKCDRPLPQITDTIQRVIREHSIDYAVVDSIGYACGGTPEAAEVATYYQQCVRRWGVGSLHLAHTTKNTADGTSARRPFGSTYWHNGCRESWNLTAGKTKRLSDDAAETELTWTHRKNNFGTLEQNPRKYRLTGDSKTLTLTPRLMAFKQTDVQRLCDALRVRSMTRPELCERLDMESKRLRPVLARAKKAGLVTADGEHIRLAAEKAA